MKSKYNLLRVGVFSILSMLCGGARADEALVRHAPVINGSVDGSVQQMLGESVTLNGGATVTGDLLVPGTPTVLLNGAPAYGGTVDGTGSASPSNYQIILNGNSSLRHVVRRTDSIPLPTVSAPPAPQGTRNVVINSSSQSIGDPATLRNLTLNGNVGQVAVPPGTYGNFMANGNSGFTLGTAGSTTPSVYNLQSLTLDGGTRIEILGPVVINLKNSLSANGTVGVGGKPEWLKLNLATGSLTLNGGSSLYGIVVAPSGHVVLNGNSRLEGGLYCDRLTINGNGVLKLTGSGSENQAPTANPLAVATIEDTPQSFVLTGADPESAPLTFAVLTQPTQGTLSGVAPDLTYTPFPDANGSDSFTFKVNDGLLDSPAATVAITITPVNDVPIAASFPVATTEEAGVDFVLSATDVDNTNLTFRVLSGPAHGTLTGTGATRRYQPAANYTGGDTFTYVANDGLLDSAPATVTITVSPVNDTPVPAALSITTDEDTPKPFVLSGTDIDGDQLHFAIVEQPARGHLEGAAPNFTYVPDADYHGSDSFKFTVADADNTSAPALVPITVKSVNDAPVATSQTLVTDEDTDCAVTLSGQDVDGDQLNYTVTATPLHGTLLGNAPNLTYRPNPNYSGPDSFTFTVTDNALVSAPATISITVNPVNDAPEALAQSVATPEDTPTAIVLAGQDVEGAQLTYTLVAGPAHGTLTGTAPNLTYTPAADYNGNDSFTFKVSDGELESAEATVSITVSPTNDAPTADTLPITTPEDTPILVALHGSDVDGDTLSYMIIDLPKLGVLTNNSGSITYTPNPDANGTDSFTYAAFDGTAYSSPATVSIAVTPVDDSPVPVAVSITTAENTPKSIVLSATDIDSTELTYAVTAPPSHGTLSGTAPSLIYSPAPYYYGADTFEYTVSDGTSTSAPQTVPITITHIINSHPTVTLTSPTDASVFAAPASVTLAATAVDSDGSVAKVEFFNGTTKLGEVASAPYQLVWSNVASGAYALTAVATDNSGASTASAPVSITVNALPVAVSQSVTTTVGTAVAINLTATDAENDLLVYTIETQPTHGTLSGTAPNLTYTPQAGFTGSDAFVFTASDQYGDSVPATVSIQVQAQPTPPTAEGVTVEVMVGSSIPFALQGASPSGGILSFALTSNPALGTIQLGALSGQSMPVTYTAGSVPGVDIFTYTVSDGQLVSAPATIKVRIVPVPPTGEGANGKAGGIVRDAATLEPLEGAIVRVRDYPGAILSGEDGHFMIQVFGFGEETAKMIVLEYDAPGYITSYRRVIAYPDVPVTAEPVFLKKYDSKVTNIGSSGGTATNAAGDVQVEFPAGAVSGNIAVQFTNYSYGRELPGFLPKSSAFTYAVDLAPNGATFSTPVTVRIANVLGFAPNTPIPVGLFNPETVRWEPESMGTVSADGQWVVCQVTHFSTRDCNFPIYPGKTDNRPDDTNPDENTDNIETDPGVSIARGTYEAEIDLPGYRNLGQERAIKLRYESEPAAGKRLLVVQAYSGRWTASPQARSFALDIAGRNYQSTFAGEAANQDGSFLGGSVVDLKDLPTGLYPYTMSVSNLYTSTYAATTVFGGSADASTGIATREAIPYTSSAQAWLPWVNQVNSPYGAGWAVEGVSRLYFSTGSNQIMKMTGGSKRKLFQQRIGLYESTNQAGPFTQGALFSLRRDYQGGLLVAHGTGISRMKPDKSLSVILDGVLGSRNTNGGSSGSIVVPGGVVDACETESGTIYFITRIDIPNISSPIQTSGLFRIDPGSSTIVPVATDLVAPREVQVDRLSRIYVYDDGNSSLWRYTSSGTRQLITEDIHYFNGMAYDEGLNRLFFCAHGKIQYVSGTDEIVEYAATTSVQDIYNAGRPIVTENGELYIFAECRVDGNYVTAMFNFSNSGRLLKYETSDHINFGTSFRWERTRLGKFWFINDWVNLDQVGGGGGANAQLAAASMSVTAQSSEVKVMADSATDAFLVELRDYDASDKIYVNRGARLEEISKTDTGWKLTDFEGTVSQYSTAGLLTESKDRHGNATNYSYDTQNRLASIIDPVGATTVFTYDTAGKLSQIKDPAGRSTSFQIDASGNLISVTLPDGANTRYAYDADHHITEKTDPLQNKMIFTVSSLGVYSNIKYADNTTTGFDAQRPKTLAATDPVPGVNRGTDSDLPASIEAGKPDKLTDANGNKSSFSLDARGYLNSKTDALGFAKTVFRDSRDRIATQIDPRGGQSRPFYDEAGNLTEFTDASGARYSYYYDRSLNLPTMTVDPNGNTTTFEYDTTGNLIKRTDALGNSTTYTYNSRGQVLTITNALGETTRWTYDNLGNIQTVTDPLGKTTSLTCDSAGRVVSATDPLGHTMAFSYDAANRILTTTTADGAITTFAYDAKGNRTSATDPLGHTTSFVYDSTDQLVKMIAPDNSETKFVYDAMGNRTQVIDPLGHVTKYLYDAANRLVGVTDALNQTTAYTLDGNGNKTTITDPLDRVTAIAYDALNRPTSTTAPDGGVTAFSYDSAGNLLRLTDPLNHTTTWEYDALNRATKTTDPLARIRLASYDAAGRVATQNNGRGQVLRYTYDVAGRPSALDLAGMDTITWSYDAAGNLLQVGDSDSVVSTTYDMMSRPVTVQQTYGTVSYTYDLTGRRTQLTNGTGSVNYIYDPLNRLTGLTDQASRSYGFAYDLAGRLTRQDFPNGTYTTFAYDAASQLTDKVHYRSIGTTLGDNTYVFDAGGNITGWGGSDGNVRIFTYDPNDRLTAANSSLASVANEAFPFDKVGNWTPYQNRLHNSGNEITEDNLYVYNYDLDGNLVEKASKLDLNDVTTYQWDPLNRLVQVNKGTYVVSYRYDGLGRRIAKVVDGVETQYVLDGMNVLEERNDSNMLLAYNLHGGLDQLLMRQDLTNAVTFWIHTDHLGSVESLTDAAGTIVERYRYSSFGWPTVMDSAFIPQASNPRIPFTYTAREWEPEIGMYFYRARFMDPKLGRFISQDPLRFGAGDLNWLAYVKNGPIILTDQLGLFSGTFIQAGGATDSLTIGGGSKNLGITNIPDRVSINFSNGEINAKLVVPYEYLTPKGVLDHWEDLWPEEKEAGTKKCEINATAVSDRARLDELEHVNDMKDWFDNQLPALAKPLEKQYAGQLDTNVAKNDIRKQISDSYKQAIKGTERRDTSGQHRITINGTRM